MKKYLFLIGLFCVIMMFISANLGDKIINEPLWLSLGIFLIVALCIYPLVMKLFKKEKANVNAETKTNKIFLGIIWLSLAAATTFVILTPFRYAIILSAKPNTEEVKVCEIKSFYKTGKNRKKRFYYDFNGHKKKKKITISDYQKLLAGRNVKNYKLYLTIQKSIFDTHVIQSYEIKE